MVKKLAAKKKKIDSHNFYSFSPRFETQRKRELREI